ncbi:acyloxyacyl hydrolase [Galenea microaerophila]
MRHMTRLFIALFCLISLQPAKAQNATEDTLMNLAIQGTLLTLIGSSIWGENPFRESLHLKPQWGVGFQQGADHSVSLTQIQLVRPFKNALYTGKQWDLTAHWEFDAGYWSSSKKHPKNEDGYFFGATPVFQYTWLGWNIHPYIEVGAGVKYLDNITIENNYKSTQFQFGDIFGVGIGNAHYHIGYRYLHISNANIELPNPGNNFQTFHIQYLF